MFHLGKNSEKYWSFIGSISDLRNAHSAVEDPDADSGMTEKHKRLMVFGGRQLSKP